MNDVYGLLKCNVCGEEFIGRKPIEDGIPVFCSKHIEIGTLPIINEQDKLPSSVHTELRGGKGNE